MMLNNVCHFIDDRLFEVKNGNTIKRNDKRREKCYFAAMVPEAGRHFECREDPGDEVNFPALFP